MKSKFKTTLIDSYSNPIFNSFQCTKVDYRRIGRCHCFEPEVFLLLLLLCLVFPLSKLVLYDHHISPYSYISKDKEMVVYCYQQKKKREKKQIRSRIKTQKRKIQNKTKISNHFRWIWSSETHQ